MKYLGDFPTGAVIYIPFATYDKDDGSSITMTGLAVTDIEIYKNGSATQRASDAGYTLLDTDGIDFDAITGIHGFSVDTSDNTDAGFYAAGSEYWVVISAVTVDAVTVNFIAATFSIERSGAALALLKNATYGLSALETIVDDLEGRLTATRAGYFDNLSGGAVALASGVTVTTNSDKTGYSLTQAFPTNFSSLSITAGGLVDITQAAADKVWSTAARTLTSFGTLIADIWGYATRLLTAGTNIVLAKGTGVTGFNDLSAAQVNTEVDTALADINLDHIAGTAVAIPAIPAGTYIDQMMDDGTAVYDRTTDSLQAIADSGGGGLTQQQVRDSMKLAPTVGAPSVGSVDEHLDDILADTADMQPKLGTPAGASIAADILAIDNFVDTEVAAIKAKTDQLTFTVANQVDANALTVGDKTGYALTADMRIKKNTALANFMFVMLNSTDHITPQTGLIVTATRSLDGAAFAACANAVTELSNGIYKINLASGDLNADVVTFRFTATGGDDRLITIVTQTE